MGCEPVVEVSGVSKRFCSDLNRSLRYGVMDIAREFLPISTPRQGLRRDEFWAVDDVSFTVQPGEAIAIAGRNGAGKSTLMRLLAGILKPDRGEISLTGRVNPVIELGQGLNSLLTGRENAALGMAWRGAERRHIEDLVEQVAAFSDLGDFFDSPISQYSAGMRVRLAFAIAAHIPARLMVLDEVLSVGDVAFQVKCMRKVRAHLDDGGSLILVSHNPFQMQTVCSRGLLMDQGRIVFDGPIEHCLDRALDAQLANPAAKAPARPRNPQALEVLGVSLSTDLPGGKLRPGGAFDVTVRYRTSRPVTLLFGISIWSADGSLCLAHFPDTHPVALRPGTGQKRCHISSLPLAHGRYSVRAVLIDPETMFAVASFGFDDAPALFMVEDDVSRIAILARNAGQILKLPSVWSDVSDVTIDESDEA